MKHLPFGLRTVKTALSVGLAVFLVRFITDSSDAMFYAALGGLVAMDTTFRRSLHQGLTQFLSVCFGTVVAYAALRFFPAMPAWIVGLGIFLLIFLCNRLKFSYTISLSCIVFLSACIYTTDDLLRDALHRIEYTALGLAIALAINVAVRPYNNKNRICTLLRRLQAMIPPALESIVICERFPDVQPMVELLRALDAELALYRSQHWFHRKHDAEALLEGCVQLAERMVQELEAICGMDTLGDIASDNAQSLQELGIALPKLAPRKCTRRDTIVMNYHLETLLSAYGYLDALLSE